MAMDFFKVMVAFRRHPKVLMIKDDHENANDILMSLQNLWAYCMESSQDGSLGSSIRRIERAAEWNGKPGELIKILTDKDTTFIDLVDGKYSMHNWLKHNSKLGSERKAAESADKSKAANVKWHAVDVERLKKNGVKIEDCKWLRVNEIGRLEVVYDKVPNFMELGEELFYSREEFRERNMHCKIETKNARKDLIKKNTKRCTKCKKIHVSTASKKCFDCQGK